MTVVKLARWYWPQIENADYYGYRWGVVIGPWLLMFGEASHE